MKWLMCMLFGHKGFDKFPRVGQCSRCGAYFWEAP